LIETRLLSLHFQALWAWFVYPDALFRAQSAGGVVFLWLLWVWFQYLLFALLIGMVNRAKWFEPGGCSNVYKPLGSML
jgi:hypothetical protein